MQFELKPLHKDSIQQALEKAERYRLLNEPGEAESICLDILQVEPEHQTAITTLLLALTDQLDKGMAVYTQGAQKVIPRLSGEYERAYYSGLICERRAKAQVKHGGHGSGPVAYEWFRQAMDWYEKAEAIRPAGNDDALLRWNACARRIMGDSSLRPSAEERVEQIGE